MATRGTNITEDAWVNITTDLTLVVGVSYTLQNTGSQNLKLVEKAIEPVDSDLPHIVPPSILIPITMEDGLPFWVKSTNGTSNVVVTES